MLIRLIEKVATQLKGRPVSIDATITSGYLLGLCFSYVLSLLRGYVRVGRRVWIGNDVSIKAKHLLRLGRGVTIGKHSIIDALGREGLTIGDRSSIGCFCMLKVTGSLTQIGKGIVIGNDVGIGDFCHIGGAGGVFIGDSTIIGAYLSVHPENHIYSDPEMLIREQGVTHQGISVGKNCWLGAKVTLLDGCDIGDGCVVAAGAVVRGSFPARSVIGGVPARVLKTI